MNFKGKMREKSGITLITLVVTIIILLILAGITIATITSDNGIIKNANDAKEQTEIAEEKEIVDRATIQAMGNNKRGNLVEDELQEQLDKITDNGKTEVSDNGEEFEVVFVDSNRYYNVDKDGNIIEEGKIVVDKSPGDITKDENGNEIEEGQPYEIWCIEDLVAFSNMVNGEGIIIENGKAIEINTSMDFSNKIVELKTKLNFKSKYSYADSERIDFGDINGNENDGNTLMNEMTTGTGFNPIGKIHLGSSFRGIFDGNGNNIDNIYINRETTSGLFGYVSGAEEIKNINISGEIIATNGYAGGIIGYYSQGNSDVEINIINCTNKAHITSNGGSTVYWSSNGVSGGIVGLGGKSLIDNCSNLGDISGEMAAGGITGNSGYYIKNCSNAGTITSSGNTSSDSYAGGIVGGEYASTISIENCYNIGEISAKKVAAGIIGGGTAGSVTIKNTYNNGNIKNATTKKVMVGNISSTITNGYYNSSLIDSTITIDNGLIDISKKSVEEFVNLLNLYKNDGEQAYPIDWEKWKVGDEGYPIFE